MSTSYALRLATVADIPALVNHRRRMFEDMYAGKDMVHDPANYAAMDETYAALLRYEIPAGSTKAWVIDDGGTIAASGAVWCTCIASTRYRNIGDRGWRGAF